MQHARRFMLPAATTVLAAASLTLSACGKAEPTAQAQPAAPAWVLAAAPDGAVGIAESKANAGEGDTVVIRGRIGGRAEPLADDSPIFMIMDLSIQHCGENPGDACPVPWDYCCEQPATIAANAATVQLVDADGATAASSPASHGFKPLDEVIVVGTVAPRPEPTVLTIRATGVYRVD